VGRRGKAFVVPPEGHSCAARTLNNPSSIKEGSIVRINKRNNIKQIRRKLEG
jgi:hypothetical protein